MKKGLRLIIILLLLAFTCAAVASAEGLAGIYESGRPVEWTLSFTVPEQVDRELSAVVDGLRLIVAQQGQTANSMKIEKNGETLLNTQFLLDAGVMYQSADFLGDAVYAYTSGEVVGEMRKAFSALAENDGMNAAAFAPLLAQIEVMFEQAYSGEPYTLERIGKLYLTALGFEDGALPKEMGRAFEKLISHKEITEGIFRAASHDDAVKAVVYTFEEEDIRIFLKEVFESFVESSALVKGLLEGEDISLQEFAAVGASNTAAELPFESAAVTVLYDTEEQPVAFELKLKAWANEEVRISTCHILSVKDGKIYSGKTMAEGQEPFATYSLTLKTDFLEGYIYSDDEMLNFSGSRVETEVSEGITKEEIAFMTGTPYSGVRVASEWITDETNADLPVISGKADFFEITGRMEKPVFSFHMDVRALEAFNPLDTSNAVRIFQLTQEEQQALMAQQQSKLVLFALKMQQAFKVPEPVITPNPDVILPVATPGPAAGMPEGYTAAAIEVSFSAGEFDLEDTALAAAIKDMLDVLSFTFQTALTPEEAMERFDMRLNGESVADMQVQRVGNEMLIASNLLGDQVVAYTADEYIDLIYSMEWDSETRIYLTLNRDMVETIVRGFAFQDRAVLEKLMQSAQLDMAVIEAVAEKFDGAFETGFTEADGTRYEATFDKETINTLLDAGLKQCKEGSQEQQLLNQLKTAVEGDESVLTVEAAIKEDALRYLILNLREGDNWMKLDITDTQAVYTDNEGAMLKLAYDYDEYSSYQTLCLTFEAYNGDAPVFSAMVYFTAKVDSTEVAVYYGEDAYDNYLGTLYIRQIPAKPLEAFDAQKAVHPATLSATDALLYQDTVNAAATDALTDMVLALPGSMLTYLVSVSE